MVRAFHDESRDGGWRLDVLYGGHGSCVIRPSVHAGRIELDHAVLVREAAVPNARVLWIDFDDVRSSLHRVERRTPVRQDCPGLSHGVAGGVVGVAGDDERYPVPAPTEESLWPTAESHGARPDAEALLEEATAGRSENCLGHRARSFCRNDLSKFPDVDSGDGRFGERSGQEDAGQHPRHTKPPSSNAKGQHTRHLTQPRSGRS